MKNNGTDYGNNKILREGPHINFMQSGVTYFYDSGWTRCRAAFLRTHFHFYPFFNILYIGNLKPKKNKKISKTKSKSMEERIFI